MLAALTAGALRAAFGSLPARIVDVVDRGQAWTAAEPGSDPVGAAAYEGLVAAALEEAKREVAAGEAVLVAAGIRTTAAVREGHAAAELIGEAASAGADLIVIGSHGHTGLARLVLGSVARSVLMHAHCSVLVVPVR